MRLFLLCFLPLTVLAQQTVDPELAAEIAKIRAIDNHAHPVRNDPKDVDFDALPVENLEPSPEAVRMRPDNPDISDAWQALFGTANPDLITTRKAQVKSEQGEKYPEWVLDRVGIDIMLANRVSLGPGIAPPHFRWVPFADALMYPLNNAKLAAATPDRKLYFPLEERLLRRYLAAVGLTRPPATLDEYLRRVVTGTLQSQKQAGAIAVKFEAAYLRPLSFSNPTKAESARIYAARTPPANGDYKTLQDFLFRYIVSECGRLGMAVHIHVFAGAGGYFDVAGVHPLLLEPIFNDPALRKVKFVMVHGGWPFTREVTPLLDKPNVYVDFSAQSFTEYPRRLSATLREWLEHVPEKVLFGTDAYPYNDAMNWAEMAWITNRTGREALGLALTGMLQDGEITRARAIQLAKLVLHDNAAKLYGLEDEKTK